MLFRSIGDAPFSAAAYAWTKSTGTLVLTPPEQTVAGQQYDFTFDVINKAEGQTAKPVTMKVDTIQKVSSGVYATAPTEPHYGSIDYSTAHISSSQFRSSEEYRPMFIRSAGFFSDSYVRQTTSHPCADNLITVSLKLNVPLYARCGTNFTLSGLTDTATPSAQDRKSVV